MAGKLAALILKKMGPPPPEEEPAGGGDEGMRSAAEALLSAIKSDDVEGVMSALASACQMAESMPHEEGAAEE